MAELKIVRRHYSTHREWAKASRAYVSFDSSEIKMEMPAYSVKGEDAALDAAWRRYNRLEREAMLAKLDELKAEIAKLAGFDVTWKFSRRAGCSCPCSPGFIASGRITQDGYPVDIYVS